MGDEQSKWAMALNKHRAKLNDEVLTVETEAAARGFLTMPGKSQLAVVRAGVEFKKILTEESAGIYKEFRERIFQVTQAVERYRLATAKLSLSLYRERELNRLALEAAEFEDLVDRNKADVSRAAAEIEARNYSVIRLRALAEREANHWKGVAIEAEGQSLDAETELARARLATAQERLKVVDAMRKSVQAESVVVEAERAKIGVLEQLIAIKEDLAQTKLTMVPLYKQKAGAKVSLAAAVSEEIESLLAIAKLGIEKAELKKSIWSAESAYLNVRLALAAQEGAREIAQLGADVARSTARVEIQTAQNAARQAVANAKAGLEREQVTVKYQLAQLRRQGDLAAVKATSGKEASLISSGFARTSDSIKNRGGQAAGIIRSSAITERTTTHNQEQNLTTTTNAIATLQHKIVKG